VFASLGSRLSVCLSVCLSVNNRIGIVSKVTCIMDWKIGGRLEQWVTSYGYTILAKTQLWWLAFLLQFMMVHIFGRLRG
jgi:hypothetical protein